MKAMATCPICGHKHLIISRNMKFKKGMNCPKCENSVRIGDRETEQKKELKDKFMAYLNENSIRKIER